MLAGELDGEELFVCFLETGDHVIDGDLSTDAFIVGVALDFGGSFGGLFVESQEHEELVFGFASESA